MAFPVLVLIIDAAADAGEIYHQMLRGQERVVVVTVPSPEAAVALCHKVRPHVIVADVSRASQEGIAFWQEIRMLVGDCGQLVAIGDGSASESTLQDAGRPRPSARDAIVEAVEAARVNRQRRRDIPTS